MYQALYRKYRPSTFDEVVGQDSIIRTLKNAIKNNKLTHAYLFTGPRGTGKTSTAKILAKTINCQNLKEFEPCNQCDSCILINNKQTTDIIEIDAASNNGVDEIRELKSKVNLVPSNSKYKVYIIDEVHMLSTGAFNALLKTLEEPPSHIIFILATTEPHKIPATILSRCQRFDFKKISVNKIVENLKRIVELENVSIEDDALKEIAILSQGGARDSISLLDQAISYWPGNITCKDIHDINGTIETTEMKNVIESLLDKNVAQLLKLFDEFDEKGKNLIKLIEELIYYLRNILVYKIAPNYFEENEKISYSDISEKIDQNSLLIYIKKFSEASYEMKKSDNEKITLELYLIEMSNLDSERNISESITLSGHVKSVQSKDSLLQKVESEKINQKEEEAPKKSIFCEEENRLLMEIKSIRIDNTLSCFNKKLLLDYREKINLVKKYLFDEEYSQWASLILDGEMKAVGKNYLIFVYKDVPMENLFNQNWNIIETILEEVYNEPVKVVASNIEEWNLIKQQFNSKSRSFEWRDEPLMTNIKNVDDQQKVETNKIESVFKDIIEYSE